MTTTPQELLAMTREKVEAVFDAWMPSLPDDVRNGIQVRHATRLIDAIMAILPGEDTRDAEIERCARWCELGLPGWTMDKYTAHLRNLKQIPEWESPP